MPDYGTLEVVPVNDAKLIEVFVRLSEHEAFAGNVSLAFDGFSQKVNPSDLEPIKGLISGDSYSIRSAAIQLANASAVTQLYYQRSPDGDDKVHFQSHGNQRVQADWLKLIPLVHSHFVPIRRAVSAKGMNLKQAQTLLRNREAQVNKFQTSIEEAATVFAEEMGKTRREIDADIKARREALDAEHTARIEALEQADAKRRETFEQQRQQITEQLDARKAELDEREKHLEALSYQDERRKQIAAIKADLQNLESNFTLSEGTSSKRTALSIFATVLVVFTGGLFAYTMYSTVQLIDDAVTGPQLAWLIIKQLTSLSAFAASSIFFIRWFQRWFDKHAEEEFRLKRLKLDLSRAGWLVETTLDWKDQTKEDLSPLLVERLSHGLFMAEETTHEPIHPTDQLASALLGASSRVSVKTPGGDIEIDRKGIKALTKEQQ
jgi:hypothetical protein